MEEMLTILITHEEALLDCPPIAVKMQNNRTHRDNSMFHKLHSGFPHRGQHMSRAIKKPHPGNNT